MGRQGTSRGDVSRRLGAYTRAHRQRRRWLAGLVVAAAAVVLCTVCALTVPASTLTWDQVDGSEAEAEAETTEEAAVQTASATEGETGAEVATTLPDGASVPEGYTQTCTYKDTEKGYAVSAYAAEGVVPEGATLKASLLSEGEDAYAAAEEALAADAGEESDYGFAALDIRFEDAEGNEVEPSGDVYVVINADGLLPDDADPSTVTVQHLAEDESGAVASVDAVADAADATDGVVNVSDDTNVQAAFSVDSFSTFTITWNNNTGSGLTVQIIDTKGKSIGSSNLGSLSINQAISISNIVDEIEKSDTGETLKGYEFSKAVVASSASDAVSGNGTAVERVRRNNNNWQYSASTSGNSWSSIGNRNTLYFVYLTTVKTVDSAAQGVHMYMFNYDSAAFSGGSYGSGDVKEGLASSTVDENGWPTLTGKSGTTQGTSFSRFFGNTKSAYELNKSDEVNNLFLQSYYDVDGTFYYSSFENFATLKNDDDNDFTVYEELGSPNSGNSYFYQRGNFMPYNTLDVSNVQNHNLYDSEGVHLSESDERYNEPLYGFNEANDHYFGMYVWADFYQPKGGQVESKAANEDGTVDTSDMIFQFTGDDDMWVYIDGVLVLDLGGIHDAQSGSINFATGQIKYTDTETNKDPNWKYTTLKTVFEAAGEADSVNWDGNTFADGSSHRIQIFYMERGAGASNLKISFNLKTIPDGQLAVTKQVENYYAPQLAYIKYTMQVEVFDEVESKWVPYANQAYTLYQQEGEGTTDKNGQFKIKYDQTAIFSDIEVGTQVRVSEVGSSDTPSGSVISQSYTIGYTVTDGSGKVIDGSSTENGYALAAMPGYGSIRVTITNKATYTRPLKLVKKFSGTYNNEAPAEFEATYTLYEQVTNSEDVTEWEVVGRVKYSELTDGSYTFWLDVDRTYKIVETFENGDNNGSTEELKWSNVTVWTNDAATGTQPSDGIVRLEDSDAISGDGVDTITMTNNYGVTTVDIGFTKVDATDTNTPLTGAEFKLYKLVEPEGSGNAVKHYYQVAVDDDESLAVTRWIAESEIGEGNQPTTLTDSNGAYTIYGLEDGTYYLEETKAPNGYQLPSEPITITISNGKVINLACGSTSLINFINEGGLSFKVTNTTGTALPETGGSGTTWLTFGGAALIAAAACGYGLKRSRERRDARS